MPIPSTIESLSTTAASNGPAGSEQRTLADDGLRQSYAFIKQLVTLGSNIASASSITPPSTGSSFHITGVTTITGIASTNSWDGRIITLIFDGILTLTHSSNLALPGSANITTAANDVGIFIQTGSGAWRCIQYQTAASGAFGSYLPLAGGTITGNITVNGNTILGNATSDTSTINGTLTINHAASSNGIALSDGSVSSFWYEGTDVLFGSSSANAVNIYTSNTERARFGAAGGFVINAPNAGNTLTVGQIAGSAGISLSSSLSGSAVSAELNNTSDTSGSDTRMYCGVAGASGGDPFSRYNVIGFTNFSAGIDNSDSDAYVISAGAAPGISNRVRIPVTGDITFPGSTSGTARATATGGLSTDENIRATGASSTIGYGTGAGGTVTQIASKSTSVTINKATGQIVTHDASLAAGATVFFNVSNSILAATDLFVVNHEVSGAGGAQSYRLHAELAGAGTATIGITNISAGPLSEALTINFAVIKGVTS